eukprot:TRINITY_DN17900_c0_g1_i1.p1 TRINITY_DN17900_c0_g1~~TRINITY_DN17900_c0_g1_i1.p1  ORF type:complete len:351 (-),score=68.93 TRINITY_DN17900_c0_g1_i1:66-1118(-)
MSAVVALPSDSLSLVGPGGGDDRAASPGSRTLRASSLPATVDAGELRKAFQADGVVDVRISLDEKGLCRGFAALEFRTSASAGAALARWCGRPLPGRRAPLNLNFCADAAGTRLEHFQLVVGNVPPAVVGDAALLAAVCSACTEIAGQGGVVAAADAVPVAARLAPDSSRPGGHRGYGFLRFRSDAGAALARERLNSLQLAGQRLTVRDCVCPEARSEEAARRSGDRRRWLFVSGLSAEVSKAWLQHLFSPFCDRLEQVDMVPGRGNAFVCFPNMESALAAASLLYGREALGGRLHLGWCRPRALQVSHRRAAERGAQLGPWARAGGEQSSSEDDWEETMLPASAKRLRA